MKRELRSIPSEALGRPMEILVYGEKGKPLMVFPSQEGRFFDYENFKMIDAIAPFIESGKIQVYCVDSIDNESWFSKETHPAQRAKRANDYNCAIVDDIVPHIIADGHENAGIMIHGCSFGGFHTANFLLKYPELFDIGLSLSGCYNIEFTLDKFVNDDVYFNCPIMFAPDLREEKIINKLKNDLLILCSGQGPWEEWNHEAAYLSESLHKNGIPCILDFWGYDVEHDWPWWQKMVVYYLTEFDKAGFLSSNHRLTKKESKDFIDTMASK